jgi:hypothetical protein
MASFRDLPDDTKNKFRKTKTLPVKVKAAVYAECTDPAASMQFNRDVTVYNLYEALLYVENYEQQGMGYVEGATARIMEKIL